MNGNNGSPLAVWSDRTERNLPGTITISRDNGTVEISPAATPDDIRAAAGQFHSVCAAMKQAEPCVYLGIGTFVLAYAAATNTDRAQAVDDLALCSSLRKSRHTVLDWARVAEKLTPAEILPGLHWSHYKAATKFRYPDRTDMEATRRFVDGRRRVLETAALDPRERDRDWVCERMRELHAELGIEPRRKSAAAARLKDACISVATVLLDWSDADMEDIGRTRSELAGLFVSLVADLDDRGALLDLETSPEDVIQGAFDLNRTG